MENIVLETISLCRYSDSKHKDLKEEFKGDSKSKFIHDIEYRLYNSRNYNVFTFQSAYVILKEKKPVGYLYVSNKFNDEVFIEISLLKKYRGMKIGGKAINEVCDYLFQNHNIRIVKLDIDPSNKSSLLTAKACGFSFDEEDYENKNFMGHMVFYKESDCYISKLRRKL